MEDYLLHHVTVRRRLGYTCKAAKAPYIRAYTYSAMADSVPDVELIVIDESGKRRSTATSGRRLEDCY